MVTPHFYNSLSKRDEPLAPREPGKVRIYNCGPTVYKRQHLGNFRRFLFADFLRRSLEFVGYEVREITNITDVGHLTEDDLDRGEDKLTTAAQAEKITPQSIAERETKQFFADLKTLNIQPAHKYPRATDHIPEMQELITTLLAQQHAYQTSTGIYFSVESFPAYGQLSGNTLENLAAGKRVEVREEKRHPADFALWIFDDKALQRWDSPWGVGYPGWHIECSAMSLKYLGSDIELHTGGEDNRFPHHENERAQSEAATGERFVQLWLHNRHLLLSGKKLAKRSGTQLTLDTLTEAGISPLAYRLFIFGSHYRKPLDFSLEALQGAHEGLDRLTQLIRRLQALSPTTTAAAPADHHVLQQFAAALSDDLNTPTALAIVQEYISTANRTLDQSPTPDVAAPAIEATLHELDRVLGLVGPLQQQLAAETIPDHVTKLAAAREAARAERQFERADELRDAIDAAGYTVDDTPAGPRLIKK